VRGGRGDIDEERRVAAESSNPLDRRLTALVGDRTAKVLDKSLDLRTVGDLLRHYPRRYQERGELTDLADLRVDDDVTVLAEVAKTSSRPMRNRRTLLEVEVTDGRATLTLTFFNQAWRERELRPGRIGLFAGKVGEFRGRRQLSHPDYELLGEDQGAPSGRAAGADPEGIGAAAASFAGAVIPVYPATAALPTWKIAQCVRLALDTVDTVPDPIPPEVRARHRLLGARAAFEKVHRPENLGDVAEARRRLKWDEAFVLQVVLAQRRAAARAMPAVPRHGATDKGLLAAFDERLPFELTAGQREVGAVIEQDLGRDHPMHRLLQGEVGAGKTLVALRAMLTVVDSGGQCVLLAPTEVLAQQHHRSIVELLGPLAMKGQLGGDDRATKVVLLTGSQSAKERRVALLDAASGAAGIVVGTHAVIEDVVTFADLGLVVIDEQHRFGVEQRDALRAKAAQPPHVLVMTATPIPRTVAMTVFGDLDVSTLGQLPRGRAPIATHVVPAIEKPAYLRRAWERCHEEVRAGHQVYVVCPRIGDDETVAEEEAAEAAAGTGVAGYEDATAKRPPLSVNEVRSRLDEGPLHGLRIEALHGRLPPERKDAVMRDFAAGAIDVLVATTVIEVGVDVPNATLMIIMDADRFGISQLHQLRGRVGRGTAAGVCLLVTDVASDTPAAERLKAVAANRDGFRLSEIDLMQRREGDVLGASQSGRRSSLRMLGVIHDADLLRDARHEAADLVAADPELTAHPALADAVTTLLDPERVDFLGKA
jgi:ATP-dependent DNA helicase RecG